MLFSAKVQDDPAGTEDASPGASTANPAPGLYTIVGEVTA